MDLEYWENMLFMLFIRIIIYHMSLGILTL
jgi:hypothetical protein